MKNNTLLKILIGLVSVLIILVFLSFIYSYDRGYNQNQFEKVSDSLSDSTVKAVYLHDLTLKNRQIRNNWDTYFKVNTNNYSYYDFGGIEHLQVSFLNDSDYLVNNAYVDVCYIIDNGTCYKTETLLFKNVPPHSVLTLDAPDSSRGKKITLEFSQIYSDKLNFLYGKSSLGLKSSIDPYFFKD